MTAWPTNPFDPSTQAQARKILGTLLAPGSRVFGVGRVIPAGKDHVDVLVFDLGGLPRYLSHHVALALGLRFSTAKAGKGVIIPLRLGNLEEEAGWLFGRLARVLYTPLPVPNYPFPLGGEWPSEKGSWLLWTLL